MNRRIFVAIISASLVALTNCTAPMGSGGVQRPHRTVLVQAPANEREAQHISGVVAALQRHGFAPLRSGHAEYQLVFRIDSGLINADVTISLSHGGRVVAEASGRDGGPRIILQRNEVVAAAVQRALEQFDSQLTRLPHNLSHPSTMPAPTGPVPYHAAPYSQGNPYGQIPR